MNYRYDSQKHDPRFIAHRFVYKKLQKVDQNKYLLSMWVISIALYR